MNLDWPLMHANVARDDFDSLIRHLRGDDPRITQGGNVRAFEAEWSRWLGVKHSVFVNSGASANFITLGLLRELRGPGEIVLSPLTWVSDVASVLHWGFTPVFADIDPRTLSLSPRAAVRALTPRTQGVLMAHIQGFDGLEDELLDELSRRDIPLIEDVCEAHGATHNGRKCGTFGLASNFSFYYAHHLSAGEGGIVCTDDDRVYGLARMFRSHGLVRELDDPAARERIEREHPDLNPQFIFAVPAFNMRNTELGAILVRNQLPRLDANIAARNANWRRFLSRLDPAAYRTDFKSEGVSNYALNLVLRQPDFTRRDAVERLLTRLGVEFRRGSAGGGNQLRQPYLRRHVPADAWKAVPEVEHIHHFGWYIGNYPALEPSKIDALCAELNDLKP